MNQSTTTTDELLVRISRAGGMSFSAWQGGGTVGFEPYAMRGGVSATANLRQALKDCQLPQAAYKRVVALVDAPVMLVPEGEAKAETLADLYRYTFSGQEGKLVVGTPVDELGAVAAVGVQKDMRLVLADLFAEVSILPVEMPVWLHLHQRSLPGASSKLYGYFHDRKLAVFSFHHNRFLFANSYSAVHAHDALYVLLYIWRQLGMDAQHDELHLVGQMPHEEWLIERLRLYLRRVYTITPSAEFNRHPLTADNRVEYDLLAYYLGDGRPKG